MDTRIGFAVLALVALTACAAPSHPKLVDRQPDPSLLVAPLRPSLPPAKPTYNDALLGWMDAVQRYLDLEVRFNALAAFTKGGK